jgi:hypothetical protein
MSKEVATSRYSEFALAVRVQGVRRYHFFIEDMNEGKLDIWNLLLYGITMCPISIISLLPLHREGITRTYRVSKLSHHIQSEKEHGAARVGKLETSLGDIRFSRLSLDQ